MSKVTIVNYGDDSRKKLINGVNQLADAVVSKMNMEFPKVLKMV